MSCEVISELNTAEAVSALGVLGSNSDETDALIIAHREVGRKLARTIIGRWGVRLDRDEIEGIVDLCLCEIAPRFCEERGASFTTFLFHHLRGRLGRFIERATENRDIRRAAYRSTATSLQDLSEIQGNSIAKTPEEERIPTDLEVLGLRDSVTPEETMLRDERIDEVRKACQKLEDNERDVITRLFVKRERIQTICSHTGLNRQQVLFTKKSAINKLKAILGCDKTRQEEKAKLRALHSLETDAKRLPRKLNRRRTPIVNFPNSPRRRSSQISTPWLRQVAAA